MLTQPTRRLSIETKMKRARKTIATPNRTSGHLVSQKDFLFRLTRWFSISYKLSRQAKLKAIAVRVQKLRNRIPSFAITWALNPNSLYFHASMRIEQRISDERHTDG